MQNKNIKVKKKKEITLIQARIWLFSIWVAAFVTYIFAFLATSLKDAVTFDQASNAAWDIAYIMVPIITAFASFWFSPSRNNSQSDQSPQKTVDQPPQETVDHSPQEIVDGQRAYAMFILTIVFHLIILGYFSIGIFAVDFYDPKTPDISYDSRVDMGIKFLLLLSSFAVLPVGFVLGGQAPSKLYTTGEVPQK